MTSNVIDLVDYRTPVKLPAALLNAKTWLVWRLVQAPGEKKPRKIPYYTTGKVREGGQGSDADRAHLVSFKRAAAAVVKGGYSGVGLAMLADNGLVGLDFDNCVVDGVVNERVLPFVEGTYAEISPSGTGVRAFFLGAVPDRKDTKAHKRGEVDLEFFHGAGFLTVTGNVLDGWDTWGWDDEIVALPPHVRALYEKRFGEGSMAGTATDDDWLASLAPKIGLSLEKARAMVNALDADCSYDEWRECGMALHHEFDGGEAALDIWKEWSRKSDGKYPGDQALDAKWSSFGRYRGTPINASWLLKHSKVAKVAARYEAMGEWKTKVLEVEDDYDLREKVCPEIAKDDRLGDIEREMLAQVLQEQLKRLGGKLPIADVRRLIVPPETLVPTVKMHRPLTEFGNAERMLDRFGKSLMYVPELAAWYVWTGVYWRSATDVEIEHYAKETVRGLAAEADDHQDQGEFYAFCAISQQARMVRNMVMLAASDPRVMVPAAELDKQPHLLCVQNGVVDLRDGTLRKPDPKLHMTKCCGCEYKPDAPRALFERTVREVFAVPADAEGNGAVDGSEMAAFFQRLIGYTSLGNPDQDCMVIPHGNGSNGKSTVLGVIRKMFGTYAKAAEAASFVSDAKGGGNAGGPREDLLRLQGARFVYVNEPDENSELREGSVKAMTGGDAITARGVYGKATTEIEPTWVVFMPTNHKPIIKGSDNGIWRRLMLIPFLRNFEEEAKARGEKVETGRAAAIQAEIEGVLAWCVEGARAYLAGGLQQPAVVRAARDAYRSQMDLLAEWLDDCCEAGPDYHEDISRLWMSWESYAKERGVLQYVRSSVSLGRRLDNRFPSAKVSGRRVRVGIRIRDGAIGMSEADAFFES